jgi:hypothetical protein
MTAGPGTGIGGARGGAWAQDARWLALLVLCLGELMIVLDVTVVGVALPSIRAEIPAFILRAASADCRD